MRRLPHFQNFEALSTMASSEGSGAGIPMRQSAWGHWHCGIGPEKFQQVLCLELLDA